MVEVVQIRVIGSMGVKVVTLEKGVVNKIHAQASQKIELFDVNTGQAPKKVRAQRVGNDCIVKVVDGAGVEEIDLVIEDFYSSNASLWGGNDAGLMQQYAVADTAQLSVITLGEVDQIANTVTSFAGVPWVMGVGAVAIAVGGGAKSGGAAPPAPKINTIARDNVINAAEAVNSVVITGTKDAGASVSLKLGGISTHAVAANADTTWSYTLTAADIDALGQGTIELSATQTDVVGNTSVAGIHTFTVDTMVGSPVLSLATDTGSSDADGITNVAEVKVMGLEAGATWEYEVDGSGTWVAGTGESFNLTDGFHAYAVRQTDSAGNTSSSSSTQSYTLDTQAVISSAPYVAVQLEAVGKTTGGDQTPQVTAIGSVGGYVVTWYGEDGEGDDSIFVQQFNPNGTTVGYAPVQLEAIGKADGVDQVPQVTAIGSAGGYVVTWTGEDSEGDNSIFVQQFNPDGTTVGFTPVQLEAIGKTDGYDGVPQVTAVGSSGGYVVTWSGVDSARDEKIFVQQFNADGTTTGYTPVQLEAIGVTSGGGWFPQVTAVGGSGGYVVTWTGQDSEGDNSIFVQQFNADGTTTGYTPVQLEALGKTDGNDWIQQVAAVSNAGGYVVTWSGDGSEGDESIFVQQFNADGTTVGYAPVQLEAIGKTDGADGGPQVTAIGSAGGYVVTWSGVDSNGDFSIFLQQFNADGTTIGYAPVQLEAIGKTNGDDWGPQVTAVGSVGSYVVTWSGEDGEGDDSIFLQQFNADGTTVGYAPVKLEAIGVTNGGDWYPQVTAVGSTGGYVVAWSGEDGAGEGDTSIFVRQFNADGTLLQDKIALQVATGQDEWLAQAETSVEVEVSYAELADGDVIQLFEAGNAVGVAHTVTSAEVAARVVRLMVQRVDLADTSLASKEGAHRLTAVVTDLAGNVSNETPVGIILKVDTLVSAPVLSLASDSGSNDTDGITNVAEVKVMGLEAGATWEYEVDGSGTWLKGTGTSFNLSDGLHTYVVRQTDAAGNTSPAGTHTFTMDTVASAPVLLLTSDSGSSDTDGVTNVATVDVLGLEAGATWEYEVDGSDTWLAGTGNSFTLTQGQHSYVVRQTDAAGNASSLSAPQSYTLDTQAVVSSAPYVAVQLEAIDVSNGGDWYPQITALGVAGSYVVTWSGVDSSGDNSIFVQQFNADGTMTGYAPVQLEASGVINQSDLSPQVASLGSSDGYVVVWVGVDSEGDDSIFVQQFNPNGTTTGHAAVQLEAGGVTNDADSEPQVIALGAAGSYVVTWSGVDSSGDRSIFVQQFNADGTVTGYAPVQLEASGVTNQSDLFPQVTSLGSSGEYVVTWYGVDSAGDLSIFVQQFKADGTTTGYAPVQLEAIGKTNGSDGSPQVTALESSGGYVVTWSGDQSEGDESIFVQQFNADGTTVGYAPVQLEAIGVVSGSDFSPQVTAVGSAGSYVVTWYGADSAGDNSIFVQQFNADGTTIGYAPVQLEAIGNVDGTDAAPQVTAVGGVGGYVVTWSGEDSAGDYSIFVQQFNADGTTTGYQPVQLEAIGKINGNDRSPQIIGIGLAGGYVVTWRAVDSAGDYSIFVQQFNADGTMVQDKIALQVAAGQDQWLSLAETSVTVEVSYAEMAEGDVIQLFDTGYAVGVAHTVTSAEVTAKVVNLTVQKTDLVDTSVASKEGAHRLTAVVTDLAGNVSNETPVGIILKVGTMVSAPVLSLASDSGSSNTDGVTNVATVNVLGLEAGATWKYEIDGNGIWAAGTGTSFNLSNGFHTYAVKQTDVAGNTSSSSSTKSYTLDTTAVVASAPRNSVQLEAIGVINGEGWYPKVTALGVAGGYVVTWYGADSAGDYSIFVQQFNPNGTTTGYAPVQLEAIGRANGADWDSQVTAVGSAGGYVVTWYGADSAGDPSVFVQQFNADGTTTGYAPVQLEAIGKANGRDWLPQVTAVGSSGSYVVTWTGLDSADDYSIFVQQFNADGTMTGYAPVQLEAISRANANDALSQVTAVGSAGGYVVTWYGADSAGDDSIFVQQFNADGTTTGYTPVQLEAIGKANGADLSPQVTAVGSSGGYVVTWYGTDSAGDDSIFVQQFKADGTTTGYAPVQLEAIGKADGADLSPQVTAVGSAGGYVVTWYGADSAGDYSIFVQQFNPNGTTTGYAPVQLEAIGKANGADWDSQVTAVGSAGGYVVTWYGDNNAGGSSIFVQQFNADGTLLGQEKIALQLAAGQDQWLSHAETSVTVEVSYAEMAEGDVIQLFDAGSAVGIAHTVTSAEVTAKVVNLTVQKTDLVDTSVASKEGAHRLTAVVTDLAGNVSNETPVGITLTVDSLLPVFSSATSVNVLENTSSMVYDANATDNGAPVDVGVAYSIGGVDAGLFNINAINGQVTFKLTPDFENPLDAGSNNIYDFKVTATDVAGNAVTQDVALTIDNGFGGENAIIDLGVGKGQLLHGIQVEGKWYYVWDVNDDGVLDVTPPSGDDRISMDYLAATFLGGGATGADITTSNRSFTVNGVQLLLPEAGVAIPATGEVLKNGTAWSNATPGWNTNPNSNPTYDGMLAIWDAYNGTGTGTNVEGKPPGWQPFSGGYYWTADASNAEHGYVGVFGGVGFDANVNYNFAMFQVL